MNAADVIRATDFILPSIEIVDLRQPGRGTNMLVDSISDAAACGLVVLGGRPAKLTDLDIRRIGASLSINGTIEESGVASAVMGNPINAVAWLANKLHEYGVLPSPDMSSCPARSSRRSRSSPATAWWRCSITSAR